MGSLLESTLNTRDLGGHRTKTGGITRFHRVWRSDVPAHPTARDAETLKSAGITTLADLRTEAEKERTPSPLAGVPGFRCVSLPIREGSAVPPTLDAVPDTYLQIAASPQTAEVLRLIAQEEAGILIHCSAGKDRTGVICALVLLFCGVSREEITTDYCQSGRNMQPALAPYLAAHPEIDSRIVTADERSIRAFLTRFAGEYGSAERYAAAMGLEPDWIGSLRGKMLG